MSRADERDRLNKKEFLLRREMSPFGTERQIKPVRNIDALGG